MIWTQLPVSPLPAFLATPRDDPSAKSCFFREKETWPAVRKDSDNYFLFSTARSGEPEPETTVSCGHEFN